MIDIVIPSFGRPHKILEAVKNASKNTFTEHMIVVVVEKEELIEYSLAIGGASPVLVIPNNRSRNYAGAINTAAQLDPIGRDYLFTAADDLNFHPGWDVNALAHMTDQVKVVGTNDLGNIHVLNGYHATHYLVAEEYLWSPGGVIDGDPGHVLFEGYDHNYTDTEFIGTAKARAVFCPGLDSVVEHIHPAFGKTPLDATYEKGNLHLRDDEVLYESRKHLWWDLSR